MDSGPLNFAFFLLAFPALLSIVNPLGGAFLFLGHTQRLPYGERAILARWVAFYSFMVLMTSLYVGGYVLSIFGISLPVLRVAGGIVVAHAGWQMLNAHEGEPDDVPMDPPRNYVASRFAFYPLTLPLTTGPGTVAVAISMGTSRPRGGLDDLFSFVAQAALTSVLICLVIFIAYRYSERLQRVIGPTGSSIVLRLSAFLLFCIGIQVLWTGAAELLRTV